MAYGLTNITEAPKEDEEDAPLGGQMAEQMQDAAQPPPAPEPKQGGFSGAIGGLTGLLGKIEETKQKTEAFVEDPYTAQEGETPEERAALNESSKDSAYQVAKTNLDTALQQRRDIEEKGERYTEQEQFDTLWPNGEWYPGRKDIGQFPTPEDSQAAYDMWATNGGLRPNPSDDEIAELQRVLGQTAQPAPAGAGGAPGGAVGGYDQQPRNRFATPQYDAGGRSRIPLMDTQQGEGRAAQQQYLNMMYQSALGAGPSAAQDLLAGQREKALRQQQQAGAVGGAAGLRGAPMEMGDIEGRLGREAAMRRAQEQQFAQQQLGTGVEQMRGSDLAAFTAGAGVLDTGATRDLAAGGQLADVMVGGATQELQAESQTVEAQRVRGTLNLSAEQLEHEVIQALNTNELNALKLKMEGMTVQESSSMFGDLVNMGVGAAKSYLSGGVL